MLITEMKSKETLCSLINGKVFIINCHGCKEVRFPEKEAKEFQKELAAEGKVTGTITTDYISTTGGLDTGATIYYVKDTPQLIDLEQNVDTTLYNDTNTITNSNEMTMNIKYIKETLN